MPAEIPSPPDIRGGKAKRFRCDRCDRGFARLEHLQRHERTHTNEKPFPCSYCQRHFSRSDLLVRHQRLSHSNVAGHVRRKSGPKPKSPSRQGVEPQIPQKGQVEDALHTRSIIPARPSVEISIGSPPYPLPDSSLDRAQDVNATVFTNAGVESRVDLLPARPQNDFPSDPFEDLAWFMDNQSPLSDELASFIATTQWLPFDSPTDLATSINNPDMSLNPQQADETELFSRMGSRLPSLQPPDSAVANAAPSCSSLFDGLTARTQDLLGAKLHAFDDVLPHGFRMPSRLALSRYLTAYVNGFHEHMPCLHIPTLSAEGSSIELVLAMASIGAVYCFETEKALHLFQVSQSISRERIKRRDASCTRADTMLSQPMLLREHDLNEGNVLNEGDETIQTAQALFLLMAEATWSGHRNIVRDALAIQSTLATLIRDHGLHPGNPPTNTSWEGWARYESALRTKWIVFCFFNLHTIVYDIPSPILSSEMEDMPLPCHDATFRARTQTQWHSAKEKESSTPSSFKDVFRRLFQDSDVSHYPPNSTLGNYILIHALIQHIYLLRQVSRYRHPTTRDIPPPDSLAIDHALRTWKAMWKATPDSSIDPSNPSGPVSFNSTALLRLAYIRLSADIGPGRALDTRSPTQIAAAFARSGAHIITRSPRLLRAVLHAAHALSIPIRIGVHLVAQTQIFRWSIQHSLATLECAFLLSKWLEALADAGGNITEGEEKMVMLIKRMLDETDFALERGFSVADGGKVRLLSANVLRVWAKAFHGSGQVWAIVDIVRESLELCADLVEGR